MIRVQCGRRTTVGEERECPIHLLSEILSAAIISEDMNCHRGATISKLKVEDTSALGDLKGLMKGVSTRSRASMYATIRFTIVSNASDGFLGDAAIYGKVNNTNLAK